MVWYHTLNQIQGERELLPNIQSHPTDSNCTHVPPIQDMVSHPNLADKPDPRPPSQQHPLFVSNGWDNLPCAPIDNTAHC